MAFTHLGKCDGCGLYMRCFYDEISKKTLCNTCYNKKSSLLVEDDCVHVAIDREAYAELYSKRGERGMKKLMQDIRKELAPDAIENCETENPMRVYTEAGHLLFSQKVDR
jgi:hypothetical protein